MPTACLLTRQAANTWPNIGATASVRATKSTTAGSSRCRVGMTSSTNTSQRNNPATQLLYYIRRHSRCGCRLCFVRLNARCANYVQRYELSCALIVKSPNQLRAEWDFCLLEYIILNGALPKGLKAAWFIVLLVLGRLL